MTAVIGAIIGVLIGTFSEKSEKLMACFIAGNFLYVALADMIPIITKEKSVVLSFF